ncbi:MAG: hypothetical protein HQL84_06070 [Magnetococcales bacterium]|nr:hypothetical protein [Magnetococcales bacterium]MBF0149597.1 hypothetical protein [Magnetococcales bacterium]MBF0347867.1 hypothetical protein [Magnetococcales bacterium]
MIDHHPEYNLYGTLRKDGKFLFFLLFFASLLFVFVSLAHPILPGSVIDTYLSSCDSTSSGMRTFGSVFALCHILEMSYFIINIILLSLYLIHVLATYYIGSFFGVWIARVSAMIVLCHAQIAVLFHTVGSEMLVCVGLSLLVAFVLHVHQSEKYLSVIAVALLAFFVSMFRPEYIIFTAIGVYPVFCRLKNSIMDRIKYTLVYISCVLFLVSGYSVYNYINSSFVGLVNGVGQLNFLNMFPSRSIFNINPMLDEQNGPSSKLLFKVVKEHLLNGEEYMLCTRHQKHILRAKDFFTSKYEMNWTDMINEVERHAPGQNLIFKASMEAIQRDPLRYILGSWIFPAFHQAHVKTDFYLPMNHSSSVPDQKSLPQDHETIDRNRESTQPPDHSREAMVQYMSSQKGNYHAAFFLKYSLFDLVPPISYFMFFSLFIFLDRRKEYRVLLSILLPTYCIFLLYSQLSVHSRLRLPYDFIFIISGILGMIVFHERIKHFFRPQSSET